MPKVRSECAWSAVIGFKLLPAVPVGNVGAHLFLPNAARIGLSTFEACAVFFTLLPFSESESLSGIALGSNSLQWPGPTMTLTTTRVLFPHHLHLLHPHFPVSYPPPALLSRVAEAFRAHVVSTDIVKDELIYKDAFHGRQAVRRIAHIIKTKDRNLALLLGRALYAQEYFRAVTRVHQLHDSASDVYQFRTHAGGSCHSAGHSRPTVTPSVSQSTGIPTPEARPKIVAMSSCGELLINDAPTESDSWKQTDTSTTPGASSNTAEEIELPAGAFTPLTVCYSPTCSNGRPCYSVICPRRLEQPVPCFCTKRQLSRESFSDSDLDDVEPSLESGLLWIHTVSKEILDSLLGHETRRSE